MKEQWVSVWNTARDTRDSRWGSVDPWAKLPPPRQVVLHPKRDCIPVGEGGRP